MRTFASLVVKSLTDLPSHINRLTKQYKLKDVRIEHVFLHSSQPGHSGQASISDLMCDKGVDIQKLESLSEKEKYKYSSSLVIYSYLIS